MDTVGERRKCEYQAFVAKSARLGRCRLLRDLGKKKKREPGFCTQMLSNKESDKVIDVVVASIVQRVVGQPSRFVPVDPEVAD